MTTILKASPRRFVNTPAIERVVLRALRYLQSGFAVHLRGPAGIGKTTIALHLADLLGHPIMLLFGDDEFKTSDLIGNQSGYTRKKVVDNFIHSVVKLEDEVRQNWVDSRLTLACREGFSLVYDEFNRSRPEVNNVLLSALEEKLLVLPPNNNRSEYIRVHPNFRAIFTSNPEEYCGVHATQDALLDRMITINLPEPDELTQQEILVQKVGIERESAVLVTRLVRAFRRKASTEKTSGLRACLMIAKICHEHSIPFLPEETDFRDVCQDILLSRVSIPLNQATPMLWELLNNLSFHAIDGVGSVELGDRPAEPAFSARSTASKTAKHLEAVVSDLEMAGDLDEVIPAPIEDPNSIFTPVDDPLPEEFDVLKAGLAVPDETLNPEILKQLTPREQAIYAYIHRSSGAKITEIEQVLEINRFQAVDTLRSLVDKGFLSQRGDRAYVLTLVGE